MKSVSEFFGSRKTTAISALLFVAVVVTYLPATQNGFVNLDDPAFVYGNAHVQRGVTWEGVRWAFTTTERGFWQPFAWLSLMLDSQLFGARAGGYHLTSLLIHALTTVLLFVCLRRMTGATWRSAFVAALFGLHPLHVESVAWAAERKDVLSAFFWMLSMLAYARYVQCRMQNAECRMGSEKSEVQSPKPKVQSLTKGSRAESRESSASAAAPSTLDARRSTLGLRSLYLLCLVAFVCGLMSKSMVVTLPIILLLLDWWPLGRIDLSGNVLRDRKLWGLVREKIPFFLLSLVFGIITIYAQHATGAVKDTEHFPLFVRIENAVLAYVMYLVQMVWPASLAAFYPYPKTVPVFEVLLSAVALLAITSAVMIERRRHGYLAVGWVWYVVTLLPVIGLLQVGSQSHADRYTYIPLIGIFIVVVWGVSDLTKLNRNAAHLAAPAAIAIVFVAAILTWQQIGFWNNSETLFRHALAVTKDNHIAHNNLGTALYRAGKVDEAIPHFQEAIRLRHDYAVAHANLGAAYMAKRRYPEAIAESQTATRISPRYAGAYRNIGTAFGEQGKLDAAIPYFQKAIDMDRADPESYYGYGVALLQKERVDEAIAEFRKALRLRPRYAAAEANLGSALMMKSELDEAIPHLEIAIKAGGRFPAAYRNLGTALAQKGRLDEAIVYLQQAVAMAPRDIDAHYNLGVALLQKGYLDEGIVQFREVLKLNPKHAAAQTNLNVALKAKESGARINIPAPKP